MIARLADHGPLPPGLDSEYVAAHRAFIAEQPGFCGGYHLFDPETGRALSLTMWADRDALAAAQDAQRDPTTLPDGRISRHARPSVRVVDVAAVF